MVPALNLDEVPKPKVEEVKPEIEVNKAADKDPEDKKI